MGLIFAGCSDNGLVVNNDSYEDQVSFFDLPYYPDAVARRTDLSDATFKKVVSRLLTDQGGVIALNDDEDAEVFVVVPGSFPEDTTFTIDVTKLVTTDGEMPAIYEFGPDGLQFSRPAVLRLDLEVLFGKNAKAVEWYFLNEQTNCWEYLMTCEADDARIACVPIYHFSAYGAKNKGAEPAVDAR
ncbi:MAG: hypothetical protein JSV52_09345 [Candidatus Zixiibacteriota bacterium]|nr:MAG: hypothetical protein JSV52_09345 [candidate division Zixibacteria bacterium]